jgi:hypothetical protein
VKQSPNFQIESITERLSSFPGLMVSLSHHLDFIRKSLAEGYKKASKVLKGLFQFLDNLSSLGRTLTNFDQKSALSDANCDFIESHCTMSGYLLIDAIEKGFAWSDLFVALQSSDHHYIPRFCCELIQIATQLGSEGTESMRYGAIMGLVWIPKTAPFLGQLISACDGIRSDQNQTLLLTEMLVYILSSDFVCEKFITWTKDIQQSWMCGIVQCLESLIWNAAWLVSPQKSQHQPKAPSHLERSFLAFLQRLAISIPTNHLDQILPSSVLFPNLNQRFAPNR